MKNKKFVIIFIILGFLLIISGIVMVVLNKIDSDKKEKENQKNIVVKSYDTFKEYVDTFNKNRSDYYENVSSNMFLETVEDYESWISYIDNYTKTVDDIVSISTELKDICVSKKYTDSDVKTKCVSFIIAYETAINYYTKDIIEFNKNIDLYNESLENKLDKYELKYEFIDIDDDGKYVGKE